MAWEDWPLGLASGKYDAVISNVGVTEERKLKFDFSSYRQGLHGFYVKVDSPMTSIKEPKDIAGLRIITDAGTIRSGIAGVVTAALNETIKERTYAKALARWNLSDEQITQSRTNPPGLKKH
ncbi:hypothetical protein ASE05_30575 [Mesorhizobium sp. Root172]|nr:hypothetical protein ASE05_30575 [Mesorhizobium sp. Root172]